MAESKSYRAMIEGSWQETEIICQPELACTSTMTPRSNTTPAKVQIDVFKLTDIADAMDSMGWKVSATIQRKWFSNRLHEMTLKQKQGKEEFPSDLIDKTSATLDWVLSFPRAKSKMDLMLGNLLSENSQKALFECLKSAKIPLTGGARVLSFWSGDVPALHASWQFQRVPIDTDKLDKAQAGLQGLDDLFGAFGGFNLYAAVGKMQINPMVDGSVLIQVPEVVVYAKDTYDFIEPEQYLGHWNKTGVRVVPAHVLFDMDYPVVPEGGLTPKNFFFCVRNRHYKEWRRKNNKGGDMLVYTDGHVVPTPGLKFTLTREQVQQLLTEEAVTLKTK